MEPNKPLSKSEKVATVEEIGQAIEKLTKAEWAKLHAFARNRARTMALRGSASTEEDLVKDAIVALLEERRHWNPKKVDFVGVVMGAVRSIASNHRASTESGDFALPASQFSVVDEDENESNSPTDVHPDSRPTHEQVLIVSNLLSEIYELFGDDPEALVVMDGWRDRMSGTEIISALDIDRKIYETIVRRIRRKAAARWPKGDLNVR